MTITQAANGAVTALAADGSMVAQTATATRMLHADGTQTVAHANGWTTGRSADRQTLTLTLTLPDGSTATRTVASNGAVTVQMSLAPNSPLAHSDGTDTVTTSTGAMQMVRPDGILKIWVFSVFCT